ncbi:MAG TPA: translocation/assembly module TamB domain-containing protein [Pyrinomonadaceae bacterium]|nr:translocation/assembly module TamB domain-containing protein [Pyrinomonadaceae bacterium]
MTVNDADTSGERPEPPDPNKPTIRRRWRRFTRRHAFLAGLIIGVGILALLFIALILYRFGYVDRYVAGQITNTFANYGIRATIKEFHSSLPPRTVEMSGIELYDSATGEQLGKIDRLSAKIRIEDLYALNLRRNINLEDLVIEGFEAWVNFDEQGRSNFRNIHIPPPEPNARILFAYSTAHIEVKNGVVHYGDLKHEISGEARNLQATIQPDDPNAPAESRMNTVTFSLTDSTFTYDDRPINNIDVNARGRVNQTRAEIQELILKSPVTETHLSGIMDDWRALRYQMNVTSSVDLTQVSDTFETKTTLRGIGNFAGTVTGEGDHFTVQGAIRSDALAADGVRLQGLNVTANGSVQEKTYQINGKAVADLLSTGDFEIDALQLGGNVMGTGTNFRWIGELRAVAEKGYGTTMTGLILHDARAEMNEGLLTASASQFTADGMAASGAKVNGVTATDLKVRNQNNVTTASVSIVKAGEIKASGATVKGVTANNIDVVDRDGVTSVVVKNIQVGATSAAGAEIGELNIAGVKLSVRNRRIEGTTADIDAGTVKVGTDGQVENLKLSRPVFVVEPSGNYRATADLSIGGGVMGRMNMGQASAKVVATSSEIQLNDFTADIFKGRASGTARIALTPKGSSHVLANFNDLDIAGPLTAFAGSTVPLTGRATGNVDLTFPGKDFKLASGTVTTQLRAEAADTGADRIPITGDVAVRADRGTFNIQQVNLQTPATTLKASGQFSFENDSNLQVDLNSSDAAELQTVLISSGLLPDVEARVEEYGIGLAGRLVFNGNIRGKLDSPDVNGTFSLASLLINSNELGSVSATIAMNATEVRVSNGQLTEADGGGAQFSLVKPRSGENNTSLVATLDRANAGTLSTLLSSFSGGGHASSGISSLETQADVSGTVKVDGIPNAMNGTAELRLGPGKIAGEQLQGMTARATFTGSNVNVENIDVQLVAGHIVASGNFNTSTKAFDFQGKAEGVNLSRLTALSNKPGMPIMTGVADFTGHIIGNLSEADFSSYQITFDGQGREVTINGRPAGTLALIGRTENKQLSITLTSGILGQPQAIAARINLAGEKLPATLETTLTSADLTNLFRILLPNNTVRMAGLASGTIKASGDLLDEDGYFSIAGLTGTVSFSELNFRVEDVQLTATTPLVIRFSPGAVNFDAARFTGPGTNITLDGALATTTGGTQNLNVNGSLNLRVLNGLSPDFFSSGTAEVAVRVGGTFEDPRLIGTANLGGASVSVLLGNERWTISNLSTLVRFTANQAQIDSLTGTLGGGRVKASGGALLEGFTVARFLLNLEADDITVPFPENFRSTLDADVEIKGSSREQLISGLVTLRRAEYTEDIELADLINAKRGESIEEGTEIELTRTALFAALRVEGRNALVVRNNLADLVGSVSLQLNGPVNDPTISGRITSTSGTLNFRNDRYDVTRALVDLPPSRNVDPVINIEGESQIKGYRVIISLTGPLSQPQAIVRSEPALPQADVVSLITTGQLSADDTSASILSQSGVGAATSLLTDALINAPAQKATSKLFGLTRFEINPVIGGRSSSTPAARLTLGRRISKEVTVTYSTNVTSDPNQILALEYRVSDRLSFIAQYEQASTRKLSARTNNFSFEIRFRKRF